MTKPTRRDPITPASKILREKRADSGESRLGRAMRHFPLEKDPIEANRPLAKAATSEFQDAAAAIFHKRQQTEASNIAPVHGYINIGIKVIRNAEYPEVPLFECYLSNDLLTESLYPTLITAAQEQKINALDMIERAPNPNVVTSLQLRTNDLAKLVQFVSETVLEPQWSGAKVTMQDVERAARQAAKPSASR